MGHQLELSRSPSLHSDFQSPSYAEEVQASPPMQSSSSHGHQFSPQQPHVIASDVPYGNGYNASYDRIAVSRAMAVNGENIPSGSNSLCEMQLMTGYTHPSPSSTNSSPGCVSCSQNVSRLSAGNVYTEATKNWCTLSDDEQPNINKESIFKGWHQPSKYQNVAVGERPGKQIRLTSECKPRGFEWHGPYKKSRHQPSCGQESQYQNLGTKEQHSITPYPFDMYNKKHFKSQQPYFDGILQQQNINGTYQQSFNNQIPHQEVFNGTFQQGFNGIPKQDFNGTTQGFNNRIPQQEGFNETLQQSFTNGMSQQNDFSDENVPNLLMRMSEFYGQCSHIGLSQTCSNLNAIQVNVDCFEGDFRQDHEPHVPVYGKVDSHNVMPCMHDNLDTIYQQYNSPEPSHCLTDMHDDAVLDRELFVPISHHYIPKNGPEYAPSHRTQMENIPYVNSSINMHNKPGSMLSPMWKTFTEQASHCIHSCIIINCKECLSQKITIPSHSIPGHRANRALAKKKPRQRSKTRIHQGKKSHTGAHTIAQNDKELHGSSVVHCPPENELLSTNHVQGGPTLRSVSPTIYMSYPYLCKELMKPPRFSLAPSTRPVMDKGKTLAKKRTLGCGSLTMFHPHLYRQLTAPPLRPGVHKHKENTEKMLSFTSVELDRKEDDSSGMDSAPEVLLNELLLPALSDKSATVSGSSWDYNKLPSETTPEHLEMNSV